MHLRDGWWHCWGFDGEGCTRPGNRQPDQFLLPDVYEQWWADVIAKEMP